LSDISDEISKRVRELGGLPIGSFEEFLKNTRLNEQPGDVPDIMDLLADHEAAIRILREDAKKCSEEYEKVEIRLIDPPEDIKKAMQKQKTTEQERRSMRLLATGEFEAAEQQKLASFSARKGNAKRSFKWPRARPKRSTWSMKPPRNIPSATLRLSSKWR
jgi:hypothetical protein